MKNLDHINVKLLDDNELERQKKLVQYAKLCGGAVFACRCALADFQSGKARTSTYEVLFAVLAKAEEVGL